jgi:hypothetical protein
VTTGIVLQTIVDEVDRLVRVVEEVTREVLIFVLVTRERVRMMALLVDGIDYLTYRYKSM